MYNCVPIVGVVCDLDLYFSWEVVLKDEGANALSFIAWLSCPCHAGTLMRVLLPSRPFSTRFLLCLLWKNQRFFCPCCVDTVILKALNLRGFVELRGPSFTSTPESVYNFELGSRLSHQRIDGGVPEVPESVQSWSLRRGREGQLREP